jgi:ribonuclease P protein component
MAETLSLNERLRYKRDFTKVYAEGKRYRGKYFILAYCPIESGPSRFAAVASKKIGNAVKRNRAKRRIRSLFRRNKHLIHTSLDMVFISKKNIITAPWPLIEQDFVKALKTIAFQD